MHYECSKVVRTRVEVECSATKRVICHGQYLQPSWPSKDMRTGSEVFLKTVSLSQNIMVDPSN